MPKQRRLVISLRVLLLLVLAFGLWLGWQVDAARRQRRSVEAIREYGGFVYYAHQLVRQPTGGYLPDPTLEPATPRWIRRLIGDEYFRRVAWVNLVYDDAGGPRVETERTDDRVIDQLRGMAGLRVLLLHDGQATDESLGNLRGLDDLEQILMWDARELTDDGVAHLSGLSNLRTLHISNSEMTDAGLRYLARLPRIERLSLQGNRFSDEGLGHIRALTTLEELHVGLGDSEITDAGLEHLMGMKSLRELDLQASLVTDAGMERLMALPKLTEVWLSDDTQVTPDCIERLKAARPGLVVR